MGLVAPLKRFGRGVGYWAAGDLLAVVFGGTGASTASPNAVFAGPSSGSAAAPGFRALSGADLTPPLAGLPTTLPSTSGQPWNNGGMLCIS